MIPRPFCRRHHCTPFDVRQTFGLWQDDEALVHYAVMTLPSKWLVYIRSSKSVAINYTTLLNYFTMAVKVVCRTFLFATLVILSVMFRGSLSSSLKMLDNRACFGAGKEILVWSIWNDELLPRKCLTLVITTITGCYWGTGMERRALWREHASAYWPHPYRQFTEKFIKVDFGKKILPGSIKVRVASKPQWRFASHQKKSNWNCVNGSVHEVQLDSCIEIPYDVSISISRTEPLASWDPHHPGQTPRTGMSALAQQDTLKFTTVNSTATRKLTSSSSDISSCFTIRQHLISREMIEELSMPAFSIATIRNRYTLSQPHRSCLLLIIRSTCFSSCCTDFRRKK